MSCIGPLLTLRVGIVIPKVLQSEINRVASYAILGAGALGGLYGGLLARAGQPVHFLLRSDYQHVREFGLRVESPLGDFHLPNPMVYRDVQGMPPVDVVVVAWKTTSNGLLRETLPRLCGPETIVLVLQNGLDVEREASDIVGADRVLGGCCFLCSNKIGPGHIRHLDFGRIAFGEASAGLFGQVTPRMEQLEAEFRAAGIDMQPAANLMAVRWKKLAWNIPFNGLSVVLAADTRQIMEHPSSVKLAESLMIEVREAAEACGWGFDETHIQRMLVDTKKMVPYDSSMLLDYRAGRPMEVEAIFGNPLRAAEGAGYSAKNLAMLYEQLKFIDARSSGSHLVS